MQCRLWLAVLLLAVLTGPACGDDASDIVALENLDAAYAARWKTGDADAVMALFTDDATLVPHHGDPPVVGEQAIRQFWFNPDYPPTTVVEWTRRPAEVIVSGDVGIVRGRSSLVWEYDGTRTTIPEGNYVMIAERHDGRWLIRMLTWNDDPRAWLQEPVDDSPH